MASISELTKLVDEYNTPTGVVYKDDDVPPSLIHMCYFNDGAVWLNPTRVISVQQALMGSVITLEGAHRVPVDDDVADVVMKIWGY